MNRPIKFRAWQREEDEYYSRMVTSEQSVLTAIRHVYNGTGIATGSGFSDINNQPNPDRYTLMQYTGLKDKYGVEIYEGDVVVDRWANEYTPVFQNGIYMAYNPKHLMQNDPSTQFNIIWKDGCEIIGNIYENPELLEGGPYAES